MVKIIGSLSTPDCDHVFTAISLMLVDVIGNMDWPSQRARDMIPDLISQQLKRNLELVDANDRAIGSRA
jgi:hypothetical protein